MTLYVGLGNPGSSYAMTRHNIGWRVIDRLVSDTGARDISKSSFEGKLFRQGDRFFLKPTTYMNLSGKSVLAVKQFFKIETDDIVVIHDDIDLPFGAIRFKHGGGHGGHNGLRSIDAHLGQGYTRIRIGVGKPEYKSQVADYVLHDFRDDETRWLDAIIAHSARAALALDRLELSEVQSRYSCKSLADLAAS